MFGALSPFPCRTPMQHDAHLQRDARCSPCDLHNQLDIDISSTTHDCTLYIMARANGRFSSLPPLTTPLPHHPIPTALHTILTFPSLPLPRSPTASTPRPSPKRPSPTPAVPLPRSRAPPPAPWCRPRPPTRPPTPSHAPCWPTPTWHVHWPTCGTAGWRRLTRGARATAEWAWWVVGGCCMGVIKHEDA